MRHIIILAGGPSPEAEVSRSTAAGIAAACQTLGYPADVWELEADWIARLTKLNPAQTFVFLGLHGCPGEDGSVQAVLDLLGFPYNGSSMASCALCMDKIQTRIMLQAAGVPVAAGLSGQELTDTNLNHFLNKHHKAIAKPANGGSTIGVTVFSTLAEWPAAHAEAEKFGPVLVEAFIPGQELTTPLLCGINSTQVLPTIEVTTPDNSFYDYQHKYTAGQSNHLIPANIPATVQQRINAHALAAAHILQNSGACRIDFRYDATTDTLVALEMNTLPGLTPTSLLPDAANHIGLSYPHLIDWMITDGLSRRA